jgi:hypothetical protein
MTTYEVRAIQIRKGVSYITDGEHTVALCGVVPATGATWCLKTHEVLAYLKQGHEFFTNVTGEPRATVRQDGNKPWVTTVADGTTKNNLLHLKNTCTCG